MEGEDAESLIAKVARDAEMTLMEERFPGYGFADHKGYATPEHLAALRSRGPCEIHRRSFEPVHALLQAELFAPSPLGEGWGEGFVPHR